MKTVGVDEFSFPKKGWIKGLRKVLYVGPVGLLKRYTRESIWEVEKWVEGTKGKLIP